MAAEVVYGFLRGVMRLLVTVVLGRRFRLEGLENVPRGGALLVCSNHVSTVDPPLLPAYLPRDDTWSMAKSEYFAPDRRFTSWLFTRYHAFPVVRHSADRGALRRALAVLARGEALIVYPEGTRVDEGRLREPEPGVGFLALRARPAVLPVALVGTNDCFPKGAHLPRRVEVRIVFGRPFRIRERRPDGAEVSREEAAEAIMAAVAELLPAANRGVFADVETRRERLRPVYEPLG